MPIPRNPEISFRSKSTISTIFATHDEVSMALARHVFAAGHSFSCISRAPIRKMTSRNAAFAGGVQHSLSGLWVTVILAAIRRSGVGSGPSNTLVIFVSDRIKSPLAPRVKSFPDPTL